MDCGGNFDPVCMDFDHVPERGPKLGYVKDFMSAAEEVLQAELAKCDLICACCHRLRTKRRGPTKEQNEKRKKTMRTSASKALRSASMREVQNRPEVRTKKSEALKEAFARPEVREKMEIRWAAMRSPLLPVITCPTCHNTCPGGTATKPKHYCSGECYRTRPRSSRRSKPAHCGCGCGHMTLGGMYCRGHHPTRYGRPPKV